MGCDKEVRARFVLINNSGQAIDSVRIMPDVNNEYESIDKGSKKEIIINMTGISRSDGAYGLQFKTGATKTPYVFGYYTNGIPLEDYTVLTIQPDTLLVKQHFDY